MPYSTDREVGVLIQDTFELLELKEYGQRVGWSWNMRLRTTLGRADAEQSVMEFSSFMWPTIAPPMRRETVIHESCHLAAFEAAEEEGHGPVWRAMMLHCGLEPRVTHDQEQGANRVRVYCACEGGILIGRIRHGRIVSGEAEYLCNRCDQQVRTTP